MSGRVGVSLCVVHVCACHSMLVEVREHLTGVSFLLCWAEIRTQVIKLA